MIIRRFAAVCVLLMASLGLIASPSAYAACTGPVDCERGKDPIPDTPNGRTFVLKTTSAAPGGTIEWTGTGFVRDAGGGQTLTFKLNDVDIIGSGVEADAEGNASGSVTLPDAAVFKKYQSDFGSEIWWVRVLVGSGRSDGEPDLPAASIHAKFELTGLDSNATTPSSSTSPTTSTTPSSTTPSSGTLPKTGIEDHGVLLASGLAAAALLALVVERRFRRRRTADSV